MKTAVKTLTVVAATVFHASHASDIPDSFLDQLKGYSVPSTRYSMKSASAIEPSPFARANCTDFYGRRGGAYLGTLCKFPSVQLLRTIGITADHPVEEAKPSPDSPSAYRIASPWTSYPMTPIVTKLGKGFAAEIDCDNSDAAIPRPVDHCYAAVVIEKDRGFVYANFITRRYKDSKQVVAGKDVLEILESLSKRQ